MPSQKTPPSFTAIVFEHFAQQQLVTVIGQTICRPSLDIWQACADECYHIYRTQCHCTNPAVRAGCRIRIIRFVIATSPHLMTLTQARAIITMQRLAARRQTRIAIASVLQHS